ncbi:MULTISPECIES: hypothetical protein [unclassified Nocardioides]|jgi:hypothetical protein|uniref:hypothetical protein n=1 Tax=Nocardioides sp. URHA0032 TaxID=1380388 RepID=UPI000490C01F|nr:hypothetical protein [Nocardioides sp. URHA0032]
MVVLGLLLMGVGAVAVVGALFTADGSTELFGVDLSATAMFFVGLGAGLAIVWGFGFSKWGTKRTLRQRRESKQLNELHEKLERREAEERKDEQDREERSF